MFHKTLVDGRMVLKDNAGEEEKRTSFECNNNVCNKVWVLLLLWCKESTSGKLTVNKWCYQRG